MKVAIFAGTCMHDPLSENPALEFELEAILSVHVVFQLNSDYCTKVVYRGLALYDTEL